MSASTRRPVVVITGASSGIGRVTAVALAREGYDLVLASRREVVLQEVAAECAPHGARALVTPADVSRPEDVARIAAGAVERFGGFDAWVNNAGVLQFGRIDETPTAALERVLAVNVAGAMFGAREAIGHFRSRGRGVLVNTASVLGVVGQPFAAAYVASKFALRGLGESLRQEVRDVPGIHVCTVLPAAMDTPVYARAANYTGRTMRPIWWLYPPETTARAIVRLLRRPRREALAGRAFGAATLVGKTVAPGLTERFTGLAARVMEVGPEPSPSTDGNLHETLYGGPETSGGWRRRYLRRSASPAAALAALSVGAAFLMAHRRAGAGRAA